MKAKRGADFLVGRFMHLMLGVGRQIRPDCPGYRPARPRARLALLTPRCIHPISIMLKVHARVADEHTVRGVCDDPTCCCVRQRPLTQHGLGARQVGPEGAIQTQQ
jgi:hypothetical protein